jgi:DNA repair protein SbcC/Rad50
MISSVTLTNWRSHESSRLNFSKGTNLIVGIMGSGKSSVMDAICFALFGNFPALQHRKLKLSDIIRSRPAQEKSAKVELEIDVSGIKYTILRTISLEGASEAEIRRDGRLLEGPQPKRVNELIEKLLSVDYDLFVRAIYSEQNNIDYFLILQRGDRKRQIDELLGIDRFEAVRSELVKAVNKLKETRTEKTALLKGMDKKKAQEELLLSKSEKQRVEGELSNAAERLKGLSLKKAELERKVGELESLRSNHKKLSEKKAGLSHTIEISCTRLSCKLDSLNEREIAIEKASVNEKVTQAKREIPVLEKALNAQLEELGNFKNRIREISEKTSRRAALEAELNGILLGKPISEFEHEITRLAEKLNAGMEGMGKLRASINDSLEANIELEKGVGKCPVCETPLTEERKGEILEKRGADLKKNGEHIKELEKELSHVNSELRKKRESLSKASSLQGKISETVVEDKKAELEEKHAAGEEKKLALEEKIRKLRESALPLERSLREIEEKIALVGFAKELSETEKALLSSKFNEKEFEAFRAELEGARISESELMARKGGLEREGKRIGDTIRLQEERAGQLEAYEKEIVRIECAVEELSIFGNCVSDTQRELREELITAINATMGNVWASVYPYGDYRELRLSADEKGYELEALVCENWVSVDGIASGGERASACLALRIAFAMVLAPNLNWLILDEPTHNLDEEAVRSLARALYEKIPELVEQTFVITHDENLREAASGSLHVITRNKGENGPSAVEKA